MLKLPRRKFLHLAAGAAALPVLPCIAVAQTYPTRPVRLIVTVRRSGLDSRSWLTIGRAATVTSAPS